MKRYDAVVATTHLDSQGERMTRGALDSLVEAIGRSYIPIGIEHDPRVPPQGRIASAFVREGSDGEFEAAAVMEFFEPDDEPTTPGDSRELVLHAPRADGITISHDWTHRSEEDQADIKAISDVLGSEPVYDMKKAADPISIITLGGAFVLGGIAAGFLGQIGVDGWTVIKEKLGALFARKSTRKGEQLFVVNALIEVDGAKVEVQTILTDPKPEDIETLLTNGLQAIERVLPTYLANSSNIRRLVFEVKDGNLQLTFAVRKDCRPLLPTVHVADILGHDADP